MRRLDFTNGNYYYLFNRGVEGRDIFIDNEDRVKFLYYLRQFQASKDKPYLNEPSVQLVDFLCFAVLDNSFHLLLKQDAEDGITNLMHPLGTAFSMYFNRRYERRGRLFEGPFRAKQIESDQQLMVLSKYIHLQPVRKKQFRDHAERIKHLRSYLWTSYQDYAGYRDGTLCEREFILEMFGEKQPQLAYREFVESGMTEQEMDELESVIFN